jgi:hypothetical protein
MALAGNKDAGNMFLKFEEAEDVARDFLGPSVELSYRGKNAWPAFTDYPFQGEYYVFGYAFKGEYRIGSERYICISNADHPQAVLISHGE